MYIYTYIHTCIHLDNIKKSSFSFDDLFPIHSILFFSSLSVIEPLSFGRFILRRNCFIIVHIASGMTKAQVMKLQINLALSSFPKVMLIQPISYIGNGTSYKDRPRTSFSLVRNFSISILFS